MNTVDIDSQDSPCSITSSEITFNGMAHLFRKELTVKQEKRHKELKAKIKAFEVPSWSDCVVVTRRYSRHEI